MTQAAVTVGGKPSSAQLTLALAPFEPGAAAAWKTGPRIDFRSTPIS